MLSFSGEGFHSPVGQTSSSMLLTWSAPKAGSSHRPAPPRAEILEIIGGVFEEYYTDRMKATKPKNGNQLGKQELLQRLKVCVSHERHRSGDTHAHMAIGMGKTPGALLWIANAMKERHGCHAATTAPGETPGSSSNLEKIIQYITKEDCAPIFFQVDPSSKVSRQIAKSKSKKASRFTSDDVFALMEADEKLVQNVQDLTAAAARAGKTGEVEKWLNNVNQPAGKIQDFSDRVALKRFGSLKHTDVWKRAISAAWECKCKDPDSDGGEKPKPGLLFQQLTTAVTFHDQHEPKSQNRKAREAIGRFLHVTFRAAPSDRKVNLLLEGVPGSGKSGVALSLRALYDPDAEVLASITGSDSKWPFDLTSASAMIIIHNDWSTSHLPSGSSYLTMLENSPEGTPLSYPRKGKQAVRSACADRVRFILTANKISLMNMEGWMPQHLEALRDRMCSEVCWDLALEQGARSGLQVCACCALRFAKWCLAAFQSAALSSMDNNAGSSEDNSNAGSSKDNNSGEGAKKAEEEKKAEEKKKAEEAKKAEEEKKAEGEKKAAEEKKAAGEKKAEEEKKAAEGKEAEEEKKAEEAKKAEEEKKAAEGKKAEEEKKAKEGKRAEEGKKAEEGKEAEGGKRAEGEKKAEEQTRKRPQPEKSPFPEERKRRKTDDELEAERRHEAELALFDGYLSIDG
jgi:hypothetical protein